MRTQTENHEPDDERTGMAKLLILTIAFTALVMVFGVTLINFGGPSLALIV